MGPPLKAAENINSHARILVPESASMGPPLKAAENQRQWCQTHSMDLLQWGRR